ncbi:MAG: hypothetical protein GXP49_04080 [Deltaproteobacteria bacterium]|nr:hypothetical protein [Deltaproteobacteria bacterium]
MGILIGVLCIFFAQPEGLVHDSNKDLKKESKSNESIKLSCEKMEVFNKQRRAVCTGRVLLEHGRMRMRCNRLDAYYGKGGKIEHAVCNEDVRFFLKPSGNSRAETREAGGRRADYRTNPEEIQVTGAPWMRQGDNLLKGKKIIYFPGEDRLIIERAKGNLKVHQAGKGVKK